MKRKQAVGLQLTIAFTPHSGTPSSKSTAVRLRLLAQGKSSRSGR